MQMWQVASYQKPRDKYGISLHYPQTPAVTISAYLGYFHQTPLTQCKNHLWLRMYPFRDQFLRCSVPFPTISNKMLCSAQSCGNHEVFSRAVRFCSGGQGVSNAGCGEDTELERVAKWYTQLGPLAAIQRSGTLAARGRETELGDKEKHPCYFSRSPEQQPQLTE